MVIQEHQFKSDSKPVKMDLSDVLFCAFVGILFSIMVIMFLEIFFAVTDHELFESISELFYDLRGINRSKSDVSDYVKKIKQATKDINNLLTENVEIKKVYEKYKIYWSRL